MDKYTEKEIIDILTFTVKSKTIKCLGISLTKEAKDLLIQ